MRNLRPVADTPLRAIIYLRQSTYREESISLDLQERACRDYAERSGYDVVAVEADPGISGRTWSKRPKVQLVMSAIEDGRADVILLWKWSRLSRSRKDWAVAADRVDVAGGRIESATEPIDTATASGRFARGVMTEYAAFQSEQIGEVWEDVRQRRLSLGLPASGRVPFGWVWSEHGKVEPHPERAPHVVEMYRRYLAGSGYAEIAKWLNDNEIPGPLGNSWTRTRPKTVMDSPIHVGLIPYRGATYPGAHEGIIDESTWNAYLSERSRRTTRGEKQRRAGYVLSHLMRCACGERMSGKGAVTAGKWYGGYICAHRSTHAHDGRAYVSALSIEPAVIDWMMTFDVDDTDAEGDDPLAAVASRRERLVRQLAQLEDEAVQILRERTRGDAPASTYDRALAAIADDRQKLADDLRKIDESLRRRPEASTVHQIRSDWGLWPVPEKNRALRRLVSRIELQPDGRSAHVFPSWGGMPSRVSW